MLRQLRDSRAIKEKLLRQIYLEQLACARDDHGGEQRISTQIKEVIVHSHMVLTKNFRPQSCERLLDWCSRSNVVDPAFFKVGLRQCLSIDFAVGCVRQCAECDE